MGEVDDVQHAVDQGQASATSAYTAPVVRPLSTALKRMAGSSGIASGLHGELRVRLPVLGRDDDLDVAAQDLRQQGPRAGVLAVDETGRP